MDACAHLSLMHQSLLFEPGTRPGRPIVADFAHYIDDNIEWLVVEDQGKVVGHILMRHGVWDPSSGTTVTVIEDLAGSPRSVVELLDEAVARSPDGVVTGSISTSNPRMIAMAKALGFTNDRLNFSKVRE